MDLTDAKNNLNSLLERALTSEKELREENTKLNDTIVLKDKEIAEKTDRLNEEVLSHAKLASKTREEE